MTAIKAGIVTPTTKAELLAAEPERERLQKVVPIQSSNAARVADRSGCHR
jgi:hypothetical protein